MDTTTLKLIFKQFASAILATVLLLAVMFVALALVFLPAGLILSVAGWPGEALYILIGTFATVWVMTYATAWVEDKIL